MHFFQVVEERGSVRDGEIKEFQTVLKVAVEWGFLGFRERCGYRGEKAVGIARPP